MNQSWSLIIFGFNERDSLRSVVHQAHRVLTAMAPEKFEILVVDDGSTDGSQDLVELMIHEYPEHLRLIRHPKNLGIGQALLTGYKASRFENVCAIPADGQFDLEELKPHVNVEPNTIVSFYRTEKPGYSMYRGFLSSTNRWLNRTVGGITLRDVNWVKIYKREALKPLRLKIKSSLVESEICGKLLLRGAKAFEVASVYKPRFAGESKAASFKAITSVLTETVYLYFTIRSDR